MLNQFSRTELLFGKAAMEKLASSRVAVFGIGGVGGYTCEALVRSGVGAFDLIDDDKVCLTNLNRQIIATRKTVGKYKAEVMKERMLEINPDVKVEIHKCFFLPENADEFPFEDYDYIVDAVDTVTAKLELVMKAKEKGVNLVLAVDAKIADSFSNDANTKFCAVNEIPDGWEGLDIGPKSEEIFAEVIKNSKTILWNGPTGVFEFENFTHGSRTVGEAIVEATKKGAFSLVGGGDSVACVNKFGLADGVSYVSTGGGALLEAIEGKILPGIAAIEE